MADDPMLHQDITTLQLSHLSKSRDYFEFVWS